MSQGSTGGDVAREALEPGRPAQHLPVRAGSLLLCDEGPRTVPPLVLLHGFTGSQASFASLREDLSRDHRILTFDLPGHGGTRVDSSAFPMSGAAQALREALDTLEVGSFSLLGYSMGGRLAIYLALELGARIDALILESTSDGIADAGERRARREADDALAASIEHDGIEAFVDRWERLPLFASLRDLPAARLRTLREERLCSNPGGLAESLRQMGTGSQPWLGDQLAEIQAPTLVITGDQDVKFNTIGSRLSASIPGARRAVVAGAGHVPHLEQPETFRGLVAAFLARKHPPPAPMRDRTRGPIP